jgi:hypothetical protein
MPLDVICEPVLVQRVSKRYYQMLFKILNPVLSFIKDKSKYVE